MNQKIKEAVESILDELKAQQKQKSLTRSELALEKNLLYYLRREGVNSVVNKRKEGRPSSKLAAKFATGGRESTIFRGTLEEAKKLREEALADPEALVARLKEEAEAAELEAEATEEEAQVLATSEQKPKKKRGRKPKAKPEGEAED